MVQAAHIGLAGLGLCDRNSVAGVVRAHLAKREQNLSLRYHPGARLVFADGTPDMLAYPRDRAGWGRLTPPAHRSAICAPKRATAFSRSTICWRMSFGLELIVMRRQVAPNCFSSSLREGAPGPRPARRPRCSIAAATGARLARLKELARDAGVPLIAVNDVLYHHPDRRPLADVLTCIREKTTIDRRRPAARRQCRTLLKPPHEMARLFRDAPEAIARDRWRSSDELAFSLDELRYEYPDETGEGSQRRRTRWRISPTRAPPAAIPSGVPDKVRAQLSSTSSS